MELQGDFSTFQRNNYKHPSSSSSSSKAVRLQRRWQELRDRECRAQQHNRQLLQDFERAQETLREMMARTAAMKMIRLDYERYLDEITPCRQQQFKDESYQKKKLERHLRECLKIMEERERQATQPPKELPSKGQKKHQKGAVPKEHYSQNSHLDYNLDDSPYARIQSSWLTNTGFQSARFSERTPSYLQGLHGHRPPPSHSSPISPHQPQPVQPYQISTAPTDHHTGGPPIWADTQIDSPSSWVAPGLRVPCTQPLVFERPGWGLMQQGVEELVERCTVSKPKEEFREDGRSRDSSDHRSQELDIKPVRLPSGHEESSVTSTDSSKASRKSRQKRKQRVKTERAGGPHSTDNDGSRQHAAAIASASVDQSSESDGSLEISSGRIRRSVGQSVTPSRVTKGREKNTSPSKSETSVTSRSEEPESQISGNQSPEEQSASNQESGSHIHESDSVNTRTEDNGDTGDTASEKSISAEQRSVSAGEGEKGKEEETEEEDENKDSSQQEEDQERGNEGDWFAKKSLSEKDGEYDDDETGHASDEEEDGEQSEESVEDSSRGVGSEEDDEGEDDASDEEGGADEQRSEDVGKDSQEAEPKNEGDSDSDSIISPQNHRSNRNIHTIPEEVEEISVDTCDDKGKESPKDYSNRSSNELSDEEDEIENLLAPQAEKQKQEDNVQKSSDKAEVLCEDLASYSEQPISEIKETQDTDSDEFDHFYD